MARKTLNVPAASAPSERVFSSAGIYVNKRRARLRNDIIELTVFLHGYWDRVEAYLRDSNGEGINVQECKNLLNSSVGSRVCRSIGNNFEFNIKVAFQSTRIVKYSLKTDYEVFFKEIPGWDHQWGRAEGLIFGSGSARVRLGFGCSARFGPHP